MEDLASEGNTIPALANRPEFDQVTGRYWRAFVTLMEGRNATGRICLSEIVAYCELNGIRDIETRRQIYAVVMHLERENNALQTTKTQDHGTLKHRDRREGRTPGR